MLLMKRKPKEYTMIRINKEDHLLLLAKKKETKIPIIELCTMAFSNAWPTKKRGK